MTHEQPSLFDMQPEPWELDDQEAGTVARVVFAGGIADAYDYRIPDPLIPQVVAGKRLQVPVGRGNRMRVAYCVEVRPLEPGLRKLKEVQEVLDEFPLLTPSMLSLTRWMAEHYLTSWGRVLEGVIPAGVRSGAGTRMQQMYVVPPKVAARWTQLKLPAKQASVLAALLQAGRPLSLNELSDSAKCTAGPVRRLQEKGLIQSRPERVQQEHLPVESVEVHQPVQLNSTQSAALHAIQSALHAARHETFVLHGVTGSGKTEVYIRAIETVMSFGRQAIVLVPEISLTPQTVRRFRARFPAVAVLHSHLTSAERNGHWQRIVRGDVPVIVGARSAVFAPVPHLGMIVIDEEHDGSFKQDTVPRYHVRDVARERARADSVPLVLGSATPSLESWVMTQSGDAKLLSMPQRILNLSLPDVVTIDLRHEFRSRAQRGPIGRRLYQAIKQAVQADEQVILLLNRRGFSTHIQCPACGYVAKCPACELPLTHHREGEKVVCHYCNYTAQAPRGCPDCHFEGIRFGGLGTQRLEAEIREHFPDVSMLRMDSDTMRRPGSHERSLDQFRRGEVQILVGTQMIAKGLDFPNVTVVGVINADTALHLPDFRAAERTFQLVTQVAGRTGRGKKGGRVFVQTYNPDHPAIRAAERHDFAQFADYELPIRQQFSYPPYGAMIRIVVRGRLESQVSGFADELANRCCALQETCDGFRLLGPAPAPIEKLRGKYRYHMIIQTQDMAPVRHVIRLAQHELRPPSDLQWQVDVDPLDML